MTHCLLLTLEELCRTPLEQDTKLGSSMAFAISKLLCSDRKVSILGFTDTDSLEAILTAIIEDSMQERFNESSNINQK